MSNFTKFKKFSKLHYAHISLKSIKITKLYTYFEFFFKKTEFLYQKFKVDFKGRFRTKMPISPVVSYSVELWRFPLKSINLFFLCNFYKIQDSKKRLFMHALTWVEKLKKKLFFPLHQNQTKGHVGFSWKNCWGFPPVTPFLFCGKIFFSEFSEKMSNFFFNEIDCKKFSKFFSMNSAVKNFEFFFNSLKLTIKNFRKFFKWIQQ